MWNFRVVKSIIQAGVPAPSLNECTQYLMSKEKHERVVESACMHHKYNGNSNHVVVATTQDLFSCADMNVD